MKLQRAIITAVGAGILAFVCFASVATAQELSALYVTPGEVGLFDYDAPASEGPCFRWDDGIYNNAIGLSSGGTMSVASRWEPSDLPAGKTIISISVGVNDAPSGDAFVQIWQGADTSSMELQYSQQFTAVSGQMNEVVLNTPYAIDYSKDLMFGWTVTHSSGQFPPSIDVATHPDLKGNLIFADAPGLDYWENLSNYGFSGDWLLEACLGNPVQYVPDTGDPNERTCNPRSYTDLGNGIVRDNVTGLEWMQATAPGTYSWQQALDYADDLNDNNTFGYDDWRVPSIEDLSSIVDAGRYDPAIEPVFSAEDSAYWSSTSIAINTGNAWGVGFANGQMSGYGKSGRNLVRATRGGPYGPFGDFFSNNDGTITDNATGLMWQQCGYGQTWDGDNCTGSYGTRTWQQALDYVQDLNDANYLGYTDWRLPTRNELQSLVDFSIYDPATTFPNTVADAYWSSTTNAGNSDNAWYVHFSSGNVLQSIKSSRFYYVRAVRGGPCWIDDAECLADGDCDDGQYCTGDPVCDNGTCGYTGDPCLGDNATPFCDEDQ
jgi:hypothetical protein